MTTINTTSQTAAQTAAKTAAASTTAKTSSSSTSTTTTAAASSKLTQDYNSFLKLLTTQMQNQDPLSPMEVDRVHQPARPVQPGRAADQPELQDG